MSCDDYLADAVGMTPSDFGPDYESTKSHLDECSNCRREQADFDQIRSLLHVLPAPEPSGDVFAHLLHRIESEPRNRPSHLRPSRAMFWGKIAAGLLLAVAAAITLEQFGQQAGRVMAQLADVHTPNHAQSPQRVTRDGQVLSLTAGGELKRKETLVTFDGSTAVFDLPGVGRVKTNGAGKLKLTGEREMALETGVVYVEIEPGRGGYRITTPSAEVEVTGTRFYVRSLHDWTAVLVLDGSVRLKTSAGISHVPACHRAIAHAARPPSTPDPIPSVADRTIHPLAALGPDPSVELTVGAAEFVVGKPAPMRMRIASDSDDLWLEPYRDASPYYLLSIQGDNEPPHTVRIVGAHAAAAIPRQRDEAPQNIRRAEFYDVTFDLAGLIQTPGNYEISAMLVSSGAAERPLWVGVTQSAPISVHIRPRED